MDVIGKREISFEEYKEIQLDILKCFIQFCQKYNFQYFLAYGSLIGAIRHKGFIPWDDDIDIQMPRSEYERFIELFNANNDDDRYYLVAPYDMKSKHTYIKLIDTRTIKIEPGILYDTDFLGVDIDIFPLDGQPFCDEDYKRLYGKLKREYKKLYYTQSENKGSLKRQILLPVYRIMIGSRESFMRHIDYILKCNDYETSEYVGDLSNLFMYYNDRHKKTDYESTCKALFENIEVDIPVGYDNILRRIYGDYMKLPPKEQQKTHHINKVYWI